MESLDLLRVRSAENRLLSRCSSTFCFAITLTFASISSGEEPMTLGAADEFTRESLRALVGPNTEIELCEVENQSFLRKLKQAPASRKFAIFAARDQIDPIIAERLKNQGHLIQFLDAPRRETGALATYMQLRSLCGTLVRCFPDRALEFRSRLAEVKCELRIRARARAARPLATLLQAWFSHLHLSHLSVI